MSNTKDYTLLQEVFVPEYSIEYLNEFSDDLFDQEILVAEEAVLSELVHETRRLLSGGEAIKKVPINIGNTSISPILNCTDYTRLKLELCNSIDMPSFALFKNTHASAIVPSNKRPDFWLIDGFMGNKVKFNSSQKTMDYDEVDLIKSAVENMAGHRGAYIFREPEEGEWKHRYFDTDDIRQESPYKQIPGLKSSLNCSAGIIVERTLAHTMLNAIDVLQTLCNERSNPLALEEYEVAKKSLKRYVPQLSKL